MPVNQFTPGINFPSGFQVANPFPLDAYLGPYPGGSTTAAWTEANDKISGGNRYQGMQVILLAPDGGATVAYKYWYRGGTANENLVEFSAGGAGLDTSNTYTWTAHQNFSAGFSAAGGVTFTSLTHFTGGLSAAGATLGTLAVNGGISASGGATFNNKLYVEETLTVGNSPAQSGTSVIYGNVLMPSTNAIFQMTGTNSSFQVNGLALVGVKGLEISTGSGMSAAGGITFNSLVQFTRGLSASGATLGTLVVNNGISASGATFANNVHVGGTLSVDGNFYVAGTMTTVNESQLLIQDKYLVLGSTLGSMAEYGTSAGIYIGTTTAPIASFAYNYNSGTNSHWVSNIPLYVGANEVLTRGNISTATGITADRINMTTASDNTNYRVPFTLVNTPGFARNLYLDSNESGSMLYNPSTNILTVTQIEAIVDGGIF